MESSTDELHRLHTLEATAKRLAISLRTLRHFIDLRSVHVVRIGRSVRVSEQEIRRLVRDGAPEP